MKIAVLIDKNKQILPFYSLGTVEVYSDEAAEWNCVKRIPFDMTIQKDLFDVQVKVKMLVSALQNCQLLIVEGIKGLPLSLLQESGMGVWKAYGPFSVDILDIIGVKLENAMKPQEKKSMRPISVGKEENAEFAIDLISLLRDDRSLNSIEILVPFMKETNFRKLQIRCSHLPKWFKIAMEEFRLTCQIEETEPDVLKVIVRPKTWKESIAFRQSVYIPGMGGGCSCGG